MILTCPECQAQYKLDSGQLGAAGRTVRCVSCNHSWFHTVEGAKAPPMAVASTPVEAFPDEAPPVKSLAETLDTILEKDGAALESVLSEAGTGKAAAPPPPVAPAAVLPKTEKAMITPRQESSLPIVTHDPLGVSAPVFGGLTFCLCTFLTLTVIFLAQKPIVHHWPQMTVLYKAIGFDVKAPGEGLRMSEVTAEQRIDGQGKVLVVDGKMTNMSEHEIGYPGLRVIMKNRRDAVMKEWDIAPTASRLAAGEVAPLMLQLADVPEDGATVELRVKDE